MIKKPGYLGFGLGLRPEHYTSVLESLPALDWFEVITENYLVPGGRPRYYLDRIREHYPMVMHGVSLSIGSTDELDWDYLRQVKALMDHIKPAWISDHLCWTKHNGVHFHDLLPLPYTEEAIKHVANRVEQVQDFLGQRILLENVSSYITYKESQMEEWEFLRAVAETADCLILLDVNNIYVSSFNHDFDPYVYLNHIPAERVQQFHLAGHSNKGTHIIDTHDATIIESVWELYARACQKFGAVSTLIERDEHIPELPTLLEELQMAKSIYNEHVKNA